MAMTYSHNKAWGEASDIPIPATGSPPGFTCCDVLSSRFGIDEPGNMALWKRTSGSGCAYLVGIQDIDGETLQVQLPDWPALVAFFEATFAYSYHYIFETNMARIEELLESLAPRDDRA